MANIEGTYPTVRNPRNPDSKFPMGEDDTSARQPDKQHQIVIVGGGAAGITVAASLARKAGQHIDIAIIDPAEHHYYQPAFTLVGAGCYTLQQTRRPEATLIPTGVHWHQQAVISFQPYNNQLMLDDGKVIAYQYLIVCPGLVLDWESIAGADALGTQQICSNYSPEHVEYTWESLQQVKSGDRLLFTQPPLPFKCPGAPQKIAYLAADYLQKKGLLASCELHFLTHAPGMFGVPFFARELRKVADRYGIHVHFEHNLTAIDARNKTATFQVVGGDKAGESVALGFDLLHFTPPQPTADFLKASTLVNEAGYVDVDQHTMQHRQHKNIFALGDACSTPNSKTAAAIRKQSPVVAGNILTLLKGGELDSGYDGYGSCPLTTAYGKAILAEFIYGGKVTPTFPLDPRKERWLNWWIKITALPFFYWHYMLKGREWFFKHDTDFAEPV